MSACWVTLTCVHIAVAVRVKALEQQLHSLALQLPAGVHQGAACISSLLKAIRRWSNNIGTIQAQG